VGRRVKTPTGGSEGRKRKHLLTSSPVGLSTEEKREDKQQQEKREDV